jgi:hypothetical protein
MTSMDKVERTVYLLCIVVLLLDLLVWRPG